MSRLLRKFLREAAKEGWTASHTSNGHYKWRHRDGGIFFSSSTPSDRRAEKNIRADMKRYSRKQPAER